MHDASMLESREKRRGHCRIGEEAAPVIEAQICRDDCALLCEVPIVHQLEKKVRLILVQAEIAHLVSQENVESRQSIHQVLCRSVRD